MGISPTLRHWQLADSLRRHRDASGLTIEQAADRLREHSPRWSRSKLQRVEARIYPPQPAEIAHLAAVYALSAADAEVLAEMGRDARRKGWWQSGALPKSVHLLAGLEQAATTIRPFELALVPGLLQTSDYTRAAFAATDPGASIEVSEGFVAARMIRQQLIKRDDPVEIKVVVGEATVACPVGGKRVMRNQSAGSGGSNCVEMAALPDGRVAVRNSNAPEAGVLFFTRAEMAAWIGGVQDHEFDDLAEPARD